MSDIVSDLGDDASVYLEELLGDATAQPLEALPETAPAADVELIGPHLRFTGIMGTGQFRRLSDFVNHHEGLFRLRDAAVLRRNGDPTSVTMPDVWVTPPEVTLIAQPGMPVILGAAPDFSVPKRRESLVVVTPGHILTGQVYVPTDALLSAFIESDDPKFIPMTDVRTRSLADRRVVARYPFALLNRRHIVAAGLLPEGTIDGGRVL